MKHFILAVLGAAVALTPARGQTAEQRKATVAYVQSLQQPDGGFLAARPSPTSGVQEKTSLRATSAALRALRYWGGETKDLPACAKFIVSCYDKAGGGFADQPGGKPDVFTTAVGIMAAVEAKVPADLYAEGAVKYLAENAKTFDDIRIAVAGLERINKPSPKADEWRKQVAALLTPAGIVAKGDGTARETGSVIVALLRLGGNVSNKGIVLKTLKDGQRPDGGFGKAGEKGSDLETSYRVMRAFHMLKDKPESPDKLKAFVATCRNADGGYGVTPGQTSNVSGTYFAAIVLYWLAEGPGAGNKPIPGIGPAGEIVQLHSGFKFTEGPAADAQGNVYFSDIPNNRILKVDADGKLSTFLEDSKGCNGLMFDGKGRLVACQGRASRLIAIDVGTKQITVLADKFEGKPFTAPNDLVVDRHNGVFFTDPMQASVYHVAADGKVSRLIDSLVRPNGVILSPDEKTLVVLPSGSPNVMAYPVTAPGKLGEGKVLCKLEQAEKTPPRGGDGLTVDTKGNFYLTQPALKAIQVVSPEGKTLGLITFPENPANCTFGGKDLKTLYVTAQTSLYTVKMEATGHRFATGK